jgi:hypothetical protein
MPVMEVRKSLRRPMVSAKKHVVRETPKLKIWNTPLMRSWVTTGVVDVTEDFMDIVGDKAVAAPLAEEPGSDEDEETAAVAFGADEFHLAVTLKLLFHSDSASDLGQLTINPIVTPNVCLV